MRKTGGFDELLKKISVGKAKVGIVGLGYVGLPMALLFAKHNFPVTGFVRDNKKKEMLNTGKSYFFGPKIDKDLKQSIKKKNFRAVLTNTKDLSLQDVIIICVPTPVDKNKKPDLNDLMQVRDALKKVNLSGKLIINESTVAPFTTREILGNFKSQYFLACSPERVDPGNKSKTTDNIAKVVGAVDNESLKLAKELYSKVIKAEIVEVSSLESAEMAKMLENTYRAVNIALINEFVKLAEKLDIDILEVIHAAKSKWSFQPHYPSIGVGGHCIAVDPYYILELAKKKKIPMGIIKESLLENESMPEYVFDKVVSLYRNGMKILVYGLTYKKDVSDLRESPAITFCTLLRQKNIPFLVYDPLIDKEDIQKIGFKNGKLEKVDIFVVATAHNKLSQDYKKVIGNKTIVIDGQNFFDKKVGKGVFGVGRTFL